MEDNKLSLKRVELSLEKFNEVAIPHHLDLLRQHKANINKYEAAGDYRRVRSEQQHAARAAARLRALLQELDALRRQVRAQDAASFDQRTRRARERTLAAIMDYLVAPDARAAPAPGSAASTESVGVLPQLQLQLEVDQQELELLSREEALRGWEQLQEEVRALHQAWAVLHHAAAEQRGQVEAVADSVAVADDNVRAARQSLSFAERIRAGAWGAGGAVVGAAVGGPIGLVAGAKVAMVTTFTVGVAGFIGGRLIGQMRQLQIDKDNIAAANKQADMQTDSQSDEQTDKKSD